MTLAGWAAIGTITVAFVTVAGLFGGLLLRGIKAWSSIDRKLLLMEASIANHVELSTKTMQAIQDAATADRTATNERLRYLEQHVWMTSGVGSRAGAT